MKLFDPKTRFSGQRNQKIYAAYEIAYTAVDFSAALLFLAGSFLFFREATQTAGTWLFVIGSVCFALKPTIRLVRELHYWRAGSLDTLARRAEE
ncbi:YrhK family protein [Oceanicella sp. SM1341]|uniref:YrhK family protein n=1 Tax=Oceanicella sp. SM1341 TaxID=1548889 RepID=UPI001E448E1C|nr:YrhK family protein [Oceanicella sp. SM1341]